MHAAVAMGTLFQSTHPVRGATPHGVIDVRGLDISIHAPREGCDALSVLIAVASVSFQSTHPVRGATSSVEAISGAVFHFNPRTP